MFNAKAVRAENLAKSENCDVGSHMGQGSFKRSGGAGSTDHAIKSMGQKGAGSFQGGNLGTFMDQAPAGGHVGK